jgi:hypothetical protein
MEIFVLDCFPLFLYINCGTVAKVGRQLPPSFSRDNLFNLSEVLCSEARRAALDGDMGKAADFYFSAAEAKNLLGDQLLAARLHSLAFLTQLQDTRYLKDKPNLGYLGPFGEILTSQGRLDMLVEGYKQINEVLRKSRHFSEISTFYLKEMVGRKNLYRQQRKLVLWVLYEVWQAISSFGESPLRLLFFIILLSLIQAVMLLPAPMDFMKTIHISKTLIPFGSFLDYWYLSLSLLFSWDWKSVHPINGFGFILILFRFFLTTAIITLFVNILVRKISFR